MAWCCFKAACKCCVKGDRIVLLFFNWLLSPAEFDSLAAEFPSPLEFDRATWFVIPAVLEIPAELDIPAGFEMGLGWIFIPAGGARLRKFLF